VEPQALALRADHATRAQRTMHVLEKGLVWQTSSISSARAVGLAGSTRLGEQHGRRPNGVRGVHDDGVIRAGFSILAPGVRQSARRSRQPHSLARQGTSTNFKPSQMLRCTRGSWTPSRQRVSARDQRRCAHNARCAHREPDGHVREVLARDLQRKRDAEKAACCKSATRRRTSGTIPSISAQSMRSTPACRVISRTTPPSPPPTCAAARLRPLRKHTRGDGIAGAPPARGAAGP
jgi:hypothetical protein